MKSTISFLFLFLVFASTLVLASDVETPRSLSEKIEKTLSVGDGREKIIAFMNREGWIYSYDRFKSKYLARTKDGKSKCKHYNPLAWLLYDCGVQININTDQNQNYVGYTVEQVFSGL